MDAGWFLVSVNPGGQATVGDGPFAEEWLARDAAVGKASSGGTEDKVGYFHLSYVVVTAPEDEEARKAAVKMAPKPTEAKKPEPEAKPAPAKAKEPAKA